MPFHRPLGTRLPSSKIRRETRANSKERVRGWGRDSENLSGTLELSSNHPYLRAIKIPPKRKQFVRERNLSAVRGDSIYPFRNCLIQPEIDGQFRHGFPTQMLVSG